MRIDVVGPSRVAALSDLMNRNCDLEGGRFSPELIRQRLWDFPYNLPEARLGAFEGDRLVGAMIGGLKPEHGFIRLFAVDEAYRERGLGGRMLAQLEETLAARGAREIVGLFASPGYFMPGLDPRYTAAFCMLERCGYERGEVVVNMVVPLDAGHRFGESAEAAERRLLNQGVRIRRAASTDRDEMREWMARHFPGGWEVEVDLTFEMRPMPSWLALRGSGIVGFAVYGVGMFEGGFGPTGVDEAARGMGIGAALMLRTLADMQARGYRECEIGWVGPIGFYSRVCGARINRALWHLSKSLVGEVREGGSASPST